MELQGKSRLKGGFVRSKNLVRGFKFETENFDAFVVGMPKAAVCASTTRHDEADSGGKHFMFEVTVQERWIGDRSRLVVGLSSHTQRLPTFKAHLQGGFLVPSDRGGGKGDGSSHSCDAPSIGETVLYPSCGFASGPWWGEGDIEVIVGNAVKIR